jgi:3-hydroxyacyl-[acyl-carrier-protein] dehydratase
LSEMDIREITKFLPHRYPFLLIDKVLSCEPGKSIVAIKNVSINEPFFSGHFPAHPVMPGVLIIEALAQAAAVLAFRTIDEEVGEHTVVYFVGIDDARFKKPVFPGDQLTLSVTLLAVRQGLWKFSTVAKIGDAVAAEAQLMCTRKNI